MGARIYARIFDNVVVYVLRIVVTLGLWAGGAVVSESAETAAVVVGTALVVAVPTAIWGRSLGKDMAGPHGIEVRSIDGQPPGWARALVREAVLYIPLQVAFLESLRPVAVVLFVAMFLAPLTNSQRRGIHDVLAGTVVVNRAR